MNQLITIGSGNIGGVECQTVNARDLHVTLGVSKDFSDWIKAQLSRARLVEGRDFVSSPSKGSSGQHRIDYHLTLDAGKHIAMMSGTEKGFDVRDYFLECERRALAVVPGPARLSPAEMLLQTAQLMVSIENQQAEQRRATLELTARLDAVVEAAALNECPANAEPITHVRRRISTQYGLPVHIIDTVMRQLPYSLKPAGMVVNQHEGAEGTKYAAFWKKDVTAVFKRFVSECQRETSSKVTHPFVECRFKLDAGMECQ